MKKTKKRIESKPSSTAAWTCTCRALSNFEKEPQYKSADFIAPKLLPKFLIFMFKWKIFRNLFINKVIPSGMYKYLIARTKYFDFVIKNALENGFQQIVIFGAGYDSRGIRFLSDNPNIKLYELDAPNTQSAKINQFKKRNVTVQSNVVFIPIDFNKESIKDKLIEAGFKKEKKSLFMLEGLIMYLEQEAVDATFKIMNEFSAAESEIVFDYVYLSVLKKGNTLYGEEEIYETVKSANEEWSFGIDKGQIKSFLETYKFNVIENLSPNDLENKYFKNTECKKYGNINATHCIVHAKN